MAKKEQHYFFQHFFPKNTDVDPYKTQTDFTALQQDEKVTLSLCYSNFKFHARSENRDGI